MHIRLPLVFFFLRGLQKNCFEKIKPFRSCFIFTKSQLKCAILRTLRSTLTMNKRANIHLIFMQIFVNLDGVTLTVSVTSRVKPVQTGPMRYQNIDKQTLFLLM